MRDTNALADQHYEAEDCFAGNIEWFASSGVVAPLFISEVIDKSVLSYRA